jgi:hypothetical protein
MVIDHNLKPISEVIPAQAAQINLPSPEPVPSQAQHNKTEQFGMKVCKNCHYPNLPIAKFCVKCNVDLDLSHTPAQNTTKGDTPAKSYAETNMKATINPWLADKKERTDQFELIPLENNDLQLNAKKSYDGQSVELTRMNLDPENETITTSMQATIYKKENKWMLSNKSKLKTTFIRIDEDMEICDGMILMFGNKCYQFKSETE